jgi:secreted trypsin-like serine protease
MKAQRTNSLTLTVLLGLASPSYFAAARASSSTSTPNPNLRQPRIINGTTAEADRYNYFVHLETPIPDSNKISMCGGSLIAADVVLTAAHCSSSNSTLAFINRHDLGDISDGIAIPVEEYLPHPEYSITTWLDNDFKLLFLRDPAPQDAAFVKLNNDTNVPAAGDYVTVMGHGLTKFNVTDSDSSELLEVELNVVSNEECTERYKDCPPDSVITDNMLCAEDIGVGHCQGDSGGPLVIKGNNVHGSNDVQVGVVSWAAGCAHPDYPGGYARVSEAFEWIRQEVCTWSMYPPAEFDCPTYTPTLEPTATTTIISAPTYTPTPEPTATTTSRSTFSCPSHYNSSLSYYVGDEVMFGDQIFICQPQEGNVCAVDSSVSVWSYVKPCFPSL